MTLRYVYGIVPSSATAAIDAAGLTGIDASPVRAIVDDGLVAIASDLDEVEWDDRELNDRVRDLDWLTPRAAAHQDVNARALEIAGALIPLSFGALYRDDERVRDMLREDREGRLRRLAELSGKAEWVVTVTRDVSDVRGKSDDLAALEREIAGSDPGRAYLLEKRRATVATAAAERADEEAARRALETLAAVSERTYREPVTRGGPDVVALRLSLLADRRDPAITKAIARIGDELGSDGYRVRASGPWPAYRFGSLP